MENTKHLTPAGEDCILAPLLVYTYPQGAVPDSFAYAAMITYRDGAYVPSEVSVRAGERVLWVNEDQVFWPAGDLHPTHRQYPGSDIMKCDTNEQPMIFDACEAMGPGAKYIFTFNEVGAWKFHDHINPQATGTVVVSQ